MGLLSGITKAIGGFATGNPIAAIGGALEIGTGVLGASKGKKAAKEQRRLKRIQQRREAIQQIREARKQRAAIKTSGANLGVGGSSGVVLGAESVGSQLEGNLGFLQTFGESTERTGSLLNKAQTFQNFSSLAGGIADQAVQAETIFRTAEAGGLDRSEVRTGTIFDIF